MTPSIKTTSFSLAKGKELRSDDAYDAKVMDYQSIAIFCDGVGSAIGGAEASFKAVSHIMSSFKTRPSSWSVEKSLSTFIETINSILYNTSIAKYNRAEMLTTLALVILDGKRLYGANIGDSAIFLYREGVLHKLSTDHVMEESGYENVLTKVLGVDKSVEPYLFENFIEVGDKILLCSDGLTNALSMEEICDTIHLGATSLVKLASEKYNHNLLDDTTAVILEINAIDEITKLKEQKLIIPEHLRVGDIIDGYHLKSSLIQNDRTWLASKNGEEFVLKFPEYYEDDGVFIIDNFVKEAWNAKRLQADFFPKAFIPEGRTHRYYVMEKLDGVSLKNYLKNHKLAIEEAICLAKRLLEMGQYLIKYDLVHGDIKPENIMVLENAGKILFKIIDLGNVTEIYSIDSKAGTPSYLAPERFLGGAISEGSEIFSIGVTLYEALCKKYPYGEIEPYQQPSFYPAKRPKERNENIPPWLDNMILRAIAKNPSNRYENYTHMLYDLEHPQGVLPYYGTNTPLFEMIPVKVAQYGFAIMTLINLILLFKLYS
jgi:serine/threonine protein phosphatase PrpC